MKAQLSIARMVGVSVVLALVALFVGGSHLIQSTATETRGDVALWLYDSDVAFGQTFDGRVRADDALRRKIIRRVEIEGPGPSRTVYGHDDNDLDFEVSVPLVASGDVPFSIRVTWSDSIGTFTETFDRTVTV